MMIFEDLFGLGSGLLALRGLRAILDNSWFTGHISTFCDWLYFLNVNSLSANMLWLYVGAVLQIMLYSI